MIDKNKSLFLLAWFIKNMHLNDIETDTIYSELISVKGDLRDSLDFLYNKYCLKISVSRNNFINGLEEIYYYIEKNVDKVEFDEEKNVKNKFMKIISRPQKENFESMTYPLFLFTQKLYFQLLRDGAKKVFFLSREGQFMKKLFDAFQEKCIGPKLKTEYLYVSRASTFVGTLDDLEVETFSTLLKQYPNMSLETFCKNLGFTNDEINEVADDMNLNFKLNIEEISTSIQLERLLNNKIFSKIYDYKRVNAKKLFTQYISQFGNVYKDKLYIVDVGWKGTIQNNIQKMLPNTTVIGYYLGLVHYDEIEDYDRKNAVLFENSLLKKTFNCYLYNSNRSIFEMLLAADHGSTSFYQKNQDNVVVPILKDEKKEYEMFISKVQPIQNNIFELFQTLLDILNGPNYNQSFVEKTINNKFFTLMFSPSNSEIKEYQSFYHFENFGVMDYSYFKKDNKNTLMKKFYNYLNFMKFVRNDDTWQYLKLYNNDMKLGLKILYSYKKYRFKNMDVI